MLFLQLPSSAPNCASILLALFSACKATLAAIGFGGGGVGLIKFIKHFPPPPVKAKWRGCVFDTCQDVVSNNERIGQRLDGDGNIVSVTTVKLPAQVPVEKPKDVV